MSEPPVPTIATTEFHERVARLQADVRDGDLDAVLLVSDEADCANVRYLSDYWPVFEHAGVFVPAVGEPILLIGPESETFAADRSRIDEIRPMAEFREAADPQYPGIAVCNFRDLLSQAGINGSARIGVAGTFAANMHIVAGLQDATPNGVIVRADRLLTALRSTKSPAEIACLRAAFDIAEEALGAVLAALRPGVSELSLVGIAQQALYERGAESEGMVQYVLSGPNSRHAISRPSHRVVQDGDVVQLNISARVSGYSSGVGRPVAVGEVSADDRELILFCRERHLEVREAIKPGVVAASIAGAYRRSFDDAGRGHNYLYGPCHGLGLMEVEPPWMETDSHYVLEQGMTFQIDSFAFGEHSGCRWENGCVITDDGVELLSDRFMDPTSVGV